jgi:hypothetical protein
MSDQMSGSDRAAARWEPSTQNHDPQHLAFARECYAEGFRAGADNAAWLRARAERAESIVVGLASTLSAHCGIPPGALIQAHAASYEQRNL